MIRVMLTMGRLGCVVCLSWPHGNGPDVLGYEKVEFKNMCTILFNVLRHR